MIAKLVVAASVGIVSCTDEPPVYEGQPFVARYGPSWQMSCPRFDDRPLPTIHVLFEGTTVFVDGVEAWNVSQTPVDEFGGSEVTFSIGQVFPLDRQDVPVVIDFSGYAGFDILSLDGYVRFQEPDTRIGNCAMAVRLFGWYVEDPEWRR